MTYDSRLLINILLISALVLTLITFILLIIVGIDPQLLKNQVLTRACTQEAKLCPDGSSVGRTGPKCEFAVCPTANKSGQVCIQVITPAKNSATGECREFPTPCDVPTGWQKVSSCPSSKIDTTNWRTYRNEDIGIEFKYPAKLSTIKEEKSNDGKAIWVNLDFVKEKENETITTPFVFYAYADDYISSAPPLSDFIENRNWSVVTECPNPLVYDTEGNVCKIMDIAGEKAVWRNFFSVYSEGLPMMMSEVMLNNKSPSSFKRLGFSLSYREIEDDISSFFDNSSLEEAVEKASPIALEYSKNIIERKNLSGTTLESLNLFGQILSTFKFIK